MCIRAEQMLEEKAVVKEYKAENKVARDIVSPLVQLGGLDGKGTSYPF
jgi:hypothetical protein